MLKRRTLLSAAFCTLGAASCGPSFELYKVALRAADISLPPERTEELLRQLRVFARANGFRIAIRRMPSSIGTSHAFELRRRDLWIVGTNPLKDTPHYNPPLDADGHLIMEIDASKFSVSFHRGDLDPQPETLDAMVAAFIASMESVEGVEVTITQAHSPY